MSYTEGLTSAFGVGPQNALASAQAEQQSFQNLQQQRALGAHDNGMGDLLRHDAERLRILVERHHLHTGSEQARALLEDWEASLGKFVKVMPKDYRRALLDLEAERNAAKTVAAE